MRDGWSVLTQAVVAGATVIYAVFAMLTYFAVNKANRLNRETLELTQAAEISVQGFVCSSAPKPLSRTSFIQPLLRNFGKTAAENVRVEWSLITPLAPKKPAETTPSVNLVPAGGDLTPVGVLVGGVVPNETEMKMLNEGRIPLTVEATVTYKDKFGRGHETIMRATYKPHCIFLINSVTHRTIPELILTP